MIPSEYQRERAICVIEREHGVKITRAGDLFTWSKPSGGGASVAFAVTASGLIELAQVAELAESLRFEGVSRDYAAEF